MVFQKTTSITAGLCGVNKWFFKRPPLSPLVFFMQFYGLKNGGKKTTKGDIMRGHRYAGLPLHRKEQTAKAGRKRLHVDNKYEITSGNYISTWVNIPCYFWKTAIFLYSYIRHFLIIFQRLKILKFKPPQKQPLLKFIKRLYKDDKMSTNAAVIILWRE